MRRIYHRKLWGEIITGNYEEKLSQEIMRRNYHRKLSASIYHHAKNVGIIGILSYPKIKSERKRGNRRVPLPFRGKRAENCSHNVGKSLGEGLAHNFSYRCKDVNTEFFLWDVEELTFLINICVFIIIAYIYIFIKIY